MEELGRSAPTLSRSLGPFEVMLLSFSALSPVASVFIGGDGVMHMAGSGAAIGYAIGGIVAAVLALLFAELGAAFPRAGGPYPSLLAVLGPIVTYPYVLSSLLAAPFFMSFTCLGLAEYVRVLAPDLPKLPVAYGALAAAGAIAVLNVRTGAFVTGLFLALEAIALAILTAVALEHQTTPIGEVLLRPVWLDRGATVPVPAATLGLAVISGAWSCAGASWALYFGEEMKDAARRVGRVVAWTGLLAALVIALPVILTLAAAPDLPEMLASESPIAAFLARAGGPLASAFVSAGVVIAIFNNLVAAAMGIGRFIYATARDGLWPAPIARPLARLDPRLRSPVTATLLLCVVAALAALLGTKAAILVMGAVGIFETVLISLAIVIGRRRGQTGTFFRIPLHPLVPAFGLASAVAFMLASWLDPEAGRPSLLLITAIYVGGIAYYRLRRRETRWQVVEVAEATVVAADG